MEHTLSDIEFRPQTNICIMEIVTMTVFIILPNTAAIP